MPKLSIHPGDSGDEAVGFDGAKNRAGLGIDLMDLPIPMLPDPQRSFRPREPRIATTAGRWESGEHTAGLWIDLMDAILGNLKEVLPIECSSRMRSDIKRALHFPTRRIERVQLVSRGEPDVLPVIGNTMHLLGTRKGAI